MARTTKNNVKIYDEIKAELLSQLDIVGALNPLYENQINDYIEFCKMEDKAKEEIEEYGITIEVETTRGTIRRIKNEACDIKLKASQQKLKILTALNLKPPKQENIMIGDDEDI